MSAVYRSSRVKGKMRKSRGKPFPLPNTLSVSELINPLQTALGVRLPVVQSPDHRRALARASRFWCARALLPYLLATGRTRGGVLRRKRGGRKCAYLGLVSPDMLAEIYATINERVIWELRSRCSPGRWVWPYMGLTVPVWAWAGVMGRVEGGGICEGMGRYAVRTCVTSQVSGCLFLS